MTIDCITNSRHITHWLQRPSLHPSPHQNESRRNGVASNNHRGRLAMRTSHKFSLWTAVDCHLHSSSQKGSLALLHGDLPVPCTGDCDGLRNCQYREELPALAGRKRKALGDVVDVCSHNAGGGDNETEGILCFFLCNPCRMLIWQFHSSYTPRALCILSSCGLSRLLSYRYTSTFVRR